MKPHVHGGTFGELSECSSSVHYHYSSLALFYHHMERERVYKSHLKWEKKKTLYLKQCSSDLSLFFIPLPALFLCVIAYLSHRDSEVKILKHTETRDL